MDVGTIVLSAAGLGLPVNRFVETIKKLPQFQALDDRTRWFWALFISFLASEAAVFVLQYNSFGSVGTGSALVQIFLTGLIVTGASNGWNSVSDFFDALLARFTPKEMRTELVAERAKG